MYVNYPPSQFESLSLTTDPHPEELEIEKEVIELPPLNRTSLPSSNGDGGIYLVQRGNSLASQKSEELQKTLLAHRHERQLVILQDFPDPDALSCAWSYQLIAQQYDIKCDIVYAGTLSHQENIALVKLTNLPAQRWTIQTLKNKNLSCYQGFVLIDNQGTTSQLLPAIQQAGIPLIVLVDHHSLQGELKSEFVDVRPYVRATATIFTQYLQAGLLTLDNSISQHVKCATALMHGLRSDTNRLMQAQEEDFMAAGYLSRFYDAQLLNAILQANRSKRVMDVIERSLKNRIVQNNFSIAGVGYLRYDDRDAIPQAADFLVTEENVHTAVVYGIVHDEDDELEVVIGSLRTTKLTLDPDEFIKEAFGQDSAGRFFGGGRTGAGGFEIPMGFLSGGNENSAYAKIKWEVFDAQIKQKLLKLVNPRDNPIQS
ncbi:MULTISPECIES: bifunctional oligoribonuclease/PAP phosphatase NrnA [Nostocales]|jgi:nanoRNase/pAp phosphatase (c-di-AMP/oligoRNAs hydrolase)|uniref:Bifunctional oligoribonuclease/PAP phosphatase NrnA n=2 Tax=Aphanizomenonaceae TaxID=1892259 RepID=A0ACC7S2Z2_DOLFA|nr:MULTISPECIES: bifunctional oligoribonuclease/PAP phosphatase NrnA [Nostocales]MBO1071244.1 bifunctional oligoribonuclease/PAP phosphatase NrnA [Dolichospermum sp. DEX189]MCX5981927.1 bifunctional oligoribonuclease/PAP phosphatase NrnA [Nostocales cyanobacterium LacPavin_0920_SED1_MAG_38_18]ALB40496.1 exopolyphosphatase-like protein [Anabaena sp. WA102]MBD2277713.1 bifunctional oligoribonuclease/PAP phosphatase NrnA [Aphanizomenon flos-aquae FACHB-1040]MBO1063999.1 bifunctional oligoribonucl